MRALSRLTLALDCGQLVADRAFQQPEHVRLLAPTAVFLEQRNHPGCIGGRDRFVHRQLADDADHALTLLCGHLVERVPYGQNQDGDGDQGDAQPDQRIPPKRTQRENVQPYHGVNPDPGHEPKHDETHGQHFHR